MHALLHSTSPLEHKCKKLENVILRAASVGDTDLLAWILQQRDKQSLVAAIDLRTLREDDASQMGPVALATSSGHVDAVKMLVDHGADVGETDASGWTPLMWAINSSNLALVAYLLQQGADVEARSHSGFTCEDFIVSIAPDEPLADGQGSAAAGPSRLHGRPPASPCSKDRELIADIVYEYLQAASQRQRSSAYVGNCVSLSTSSIQAASSTPSSSGASPQPPCTPFRQHFGFSPPYPSTPDLTLSSRHSHNASWRASGPLDGSSSTSRRLIGRSERTRLLEADLRQREVAEVRRRALLDVAVFLEVEFSDLVGDTGLTPTDHEQASALSWAIKKNNLRRKDPGDKSRDLQAGLAPGCGALEVGADSLSTDFDFDNVLPHQMMVFGEADIDPLLDRVVKERRPLRAPWVARAEPANVIYLGLRFAVSVNDEDLLANLLYATLERIEDVVKEREADMVFQTYWLFNMTLLLHYTRKDRNIASFPRVADEHQLHIHDLINEIYVNVVRDIERQINRILEAAMLEHESIPGFEDVRFEGDWNFMKTLTCSVKGSPAARRDSHIGVGSQAARRPLSHIFSQWKDGKDDPGASPLSKQRAGSSLDRFDSIKAKGGAAALVQEAVSVSPRLRPSPLINAALRPAEVSAADQLRAPDSRTVTSLLTSALHILQLYEINPAIIIQALSQVFFWMGSELFNKVLTNKRYLCRSRAMQLKLNVSALEDWAQSNALPLGIVTTHLAPLTQLISWLSCQSTLTDFDALIGTLQGLRSLTPLQMRRAVRDYRYEIGESRMSDECLQYLDQLVADWSRRQEQAKEVEEERKARRQLDQMRRKLLKADEEAAAAHALTKTIKGRQAVESLDHQRSATIKQRSSDSKDQTLPPVELLRDDTEIHVSHVSCLGAATTTAGTKSGELTSGNLQIKSLLELDIGNGAENCFAASGDAESKTDAEHLLEEGNADSAIEGLHSDESARALQSLIDSLFLPGRSMADYVPSVAPSSSLIGGYPHELLQSSTMLPFALPSATSALIVSPGDAFGFGRGHFAGTGTPNLRDVREFSGGLRASVSSSTVRTVRLSSGQGIEDEIRSEAESSSVTSSISSSAASTTSGVGSIFAMGKGFAAGGYWQPVPLVREESLDALATLMRNAAEANLALMIRRRRTAAAMLGPGSAHTSLASAAKKHPPWGSHKANVISPQTVDKDSGQSDTGKGFTHSTQSHDTHAGLAEQAGPKESGLLASLAVQKAPRSYSLHTQHPNGFHDFGDRAPPGAAIPDPKPAEYASLSPRKQLGSLIPP